MGKGRRQEEEADTCRVEKEFMPRVIRCESIYNSNFITVLGGGNWKKYAFNWACHIIICRSLTLAT